MSMSPSPLNDQVPKPKMLTLQRLAKSYKEKELQKYPIYPSMENRSPQTRAVSENMNRCMTCQQGVEKKFQQI